MQIASLKNWTGVAEFTSFDDTITPLVPSSNQLLAADCLSWHPVICQAAKAFESACFIPRNMSWAYKYKRQACGSLTTGNNILCSSCAINQNFTSEVIYDNDKRPKQILNQQILNKRN